MPAELEPLRGLGNTKITSKGLALCLFCDIESREELVNLFHNNAPFL